jgi:hypothetical protein
LGLTLAKVAVATGRNGEADRLLAGLTVLPYEGAGESRILYRQAKLMLAVEAIGAHRWTAAARLIAAARQWPERLGVGKPYPADVDERLEDWLLADLLDRSGKGAAAREVLERLANAGIDTGSPSDVLASWALRRLGRHAESAKRAVAGTDDPRLMTAGSAGDGTVLRRWLLSLPRRP